MSSTIDIPFSARRIKQSPFLHFLKTAKSLRFIKIALVGMVVQIITFKLLYPYPDFISDSHSYIATNLYHMKVNLWPVGYSTFLAIVHAGSHSDTFLVVVQYTLLETSLAYVFFSIIYLYRPSNRITWLLFAWLFFNPLFLYLSNCVLSDALFTALTVTLLTQFLWMIQQPRRWQIILQAILIGLAFTIRYTALYYPAVALGGFMLSPYPWRSKIMGTVLAIAIMVPFYIYTQQETQKITGTPQFSVFGGWQIANNALYMYDHITVDSNRLPAGSLELDRMVRTFYKAVPPQYRQFQPFPGTYFIKVPYAVLKPYMAAKYDFNDPPGMFHAWGMVSPLYETYGKFLISHHPFAFARYYLWLNVKNYFIPHLEKFGSYNLEMNTVPDIVQDWFDYPTPDIRSASVRLPGKVFYIFPALFMAFNFLFAGYMVWLFVTWKRTKIQSNFRKSLLFISTFLVLNFAFSILATPVVLRYQIVPMTFLVIFLALLFEYPDNIHLVENAQ